VIRAQGQFMLDHQHSLLIAEQVRTAKIENRKKELEQWLWERENLPTAQDERERVQREALRYARNDPSITEIWSGGALNHLLLHIQKLEATGYLSPATPLDPQTLAHINLTTGKKGGNLGLLRTGKLFWPMLLRRADFNEPREKLTDLLGSAL